MVPPRKVHRSLVRLPHDHRPCTHARLANNPIQPNNELSVEEQMLLDAYRHLPSVPRLATRRYILWRDIRLVRAIYYRTFLNVSLTQLGDEALNEVGEFASPVQHYQFPLILR